MVRPLFGLGVCSLIWSVNQCNFQVLRPLTNSCVFSYHLVSHTSCLITTVKLTKGKSPFSVVAQQFKNRSDFSLRHNFTGYTVIMYSKALNRKITVNFNGTLLQPCQLVRSRRSVYLLVQWLQIMEISPKLNLLWSNEKFVSGEWD